MKLANVSVSRAVRESLAYSAALGFVLAVPAVAAQSQSTATSTASTASTSNANGQATTSTTLKAVQVTGTMIRRTSVEQAQPIQVITGAQIRESGFTSVGQVLQTISSSGSAQNIATNDEGNSAYLGSGVSNLNLRYLGPQRTLVLVNGHRWAEALNGTVDLNTIPTAIIDHIEILQDGASAIYGSDAISGVVNIITIKNFNGAEAHASLGSYQGNGHWDGLTQKSDVTWGWENAKGGAVFNLSYTNQNPVSSSDTPLTSVPVFGSGLTRGSTNTPQGRERFIPPFSGSTDSPNVIPSSSTGLTATQCPARNFGSASAPKYMPFCDLTTIPGTPGTQPSDFERFNAATDAYNYAPGNLIMQGAQHVSLYAAGQYDIADNLTFAFTAEATRRDSKQRVAPNNGGVSSSQQVTFEPGQPFYPFDFPLSTTAPVGPGLLEAINRRYFEFGFRTAEEIENLDYANIDLSGYFDTGESEWDWDIGGAFSKDNEIATLGGRLDPSRQAEQLNVSQCEALAKIQMSERQPPQNICTPLNFFGGMTVPMTPDQVAYSAYNNQNNLGSQMQNTYASITNSQIGNLPGGPIGFAAGYQHIGQSSFFTPEAIEAQGLGGSPVLPTSGSTSSDAVFTEFDFPFISNLPGAKLVDLDVASRYTRDHVLGTTDHNTSSRAGLKWQPDSDWLLRATWSQGFRSPNISELFSGATGVSPLATDPCTNYLHSGASLTTQQNCAAAGVPPSYEQSNTQLNGQKVGNSHLRPETSISKTVGFVYSPGALPGFNANLDYYHIQVNGSIQPLEVETILNNCYVLGLQQYCALVERNPNGLGSLFNITDPITNVGGTITSGFDFGASYTLPTTPVGNFAVNLQGTYINRYDNLFPGPSGFVVQSYLGIERGSVELPFGMPRWRANASVDWNRGNWAAQWKLFYIGSMTESCSDEFDGTPKSYTNLGVCSDPNFQNNHLSRNYLGQVVYNNASVTYHFDSSNVTLTLGANNIFDKQPASSVTVNINSYDPTLYQPPMRFWYVDAGVKF